MLARASTPDVAMDLFTPASRSTVMTVRCMRKTLHTLPLSLAQAAHGATVHFRERDALRMAVNAGLDARTLSRVTESIADLLGRDGALFHRDVETRLVGGCTTTAAVRVALKLAWERGQLAYVNETTGWNREHRKFALTGMLYPELDMAMDRAQATAQLVEVYFDRYGPASLRDAMWWSGLSRSAITGAMSSSDQTWAAVRTPWADVPLYMHQWRFDEFRTTSAADHHTGLNFLAHEDVALKAYFETRRRYLGGLAPRRAFNQIGEVLPTILFEGQVVGTWTWNTVTKAIACDVVRGAVPPFVRADVGRRARHLSEALRRGWAPVSARRQAFSAVL
ncbi:DNA glycosylase AlkZ-like family protein [Umezawaea tangerina]|uniref:DNA glycosylase AlkZ-like family protein n=1 Tax=Umezawaea tangerina TaxID=84725 RepID=UPI0031836993